MSLLDYVFMDLYTASRMRGMDQRLSAIAAAKKPKSRRVDDIQTDLNSVALVCMALVGTLVEKGVISELDLEMHLNALDELDGKADGGLDVNALRNAMGMKQVKRNSLPARAKLKKKQPRGGPASRKSRKKN
jgi:hypothetical protein